MKQTKNELAIMKMSAESTSSMMLYYPNGTTLSNGWVKDKSYQVIFLPLQKIQQVKREMLQQTVKRIEIKCSFPC